MPTSVLLVSDTHVPRRARDLPPEVWREVERVDLVIHAGDWTETPLLDEFQRRSTRLLGVRGNNDGPEFADRLELIAGARIDGVSLTVVHETGPATGRESRMDREYPGADLIVFGHSHIPWDTVTPEGRRLLNPGSPTDRRRQPSFTYMTLTLDAREIRDVEIHRLAPKGA